MNLLKIGGIVKLLDHAISGIGSIAGPILAPWMARREAAAKKITAEGDAGVLRIQAEAQADARRLLDLPATDLQGEVNIEDKIQQRILFQEKKRQANITAVVEQAATLISDREVDDHEPDHDWTARFFADVQDVSSEEMQVLWARVLAGEVERPGSTSIRTLGILKNLDQTTALLFRKFCSACVFLSPDPDNKVFIDARVPSLGGNAAHNALQAYGFSFNSLNRLNEHGLILSDYNSWHDYQLSAGLLLDSDPPHLAHIPFRFQNRYWRLVPIGKRDPNSEIKLNGVALTISGRELSNVIDLEPMDKFLHVLIGYFQQCNLQMKEVSK